MQVKTNSGTFIKRNMKDAKDHWPILWKQKKWEGKIQKTITGPAKTFHSSFVVHRHLKSI